MQEDTRTQDQIATQIQALLDSWVDTDTLVSVAANWDNRITGGVIRTNVTSSGDPADARDYFNSLDEEERRYEAALACTYGGVDAKAIAVARS